SGIIEMFGYDRRPPGSGLRISAVVSSSRMRAPSIRVITKPLPVDPLPYIGRAISELDSVGFAESNKADRFAIYQISLPELESHRASFPSEQFSQRIHVLRLNPTPHAQDDKVFCSDKSFDSEGHGDVLVQSRSSSRSCRACHKSLPSGM